MTDGLATPAAQVDVETRRIHLAWLVRLRWGAMFGQLLTVALVNYGLGIPLPMIPVLCVIAAEGASNVACMFWAQRRNVVREWVLGVAMAADVVLLTALLFLTGGPFNPFSFLYLVHIALSAVVLPTAWTWGLVGFSLACFGMLFVRHDFLPLDSEIHMSHADQMRMHMQGMWFAFGVAAVFISYFVTRVRHGLSQREAELTRARQLASRGEKLASLATLATGAAHELSTPLSTIAVVAKELERALAMSQAPAQTVSDAQLIRREVERCRDILQRMAADAGQSAREEFSHVSVQELVESALEGLPGRERVNIQLHAASLQPALRAQPQAMAQALRTLIKNALQASAPDTQVLVEASLGDERCELSVRDRGCGMGDDVLARAGEPFFTTKEPGEGMGLGLFLTRVVVERSGGHLALRSRVGEGTTAVLTLPVRAS